MEQKVICNLKLSEVVTILSALEKERDFWYKLTFSDVEDVRECSLIYCNDYDALLYKVRKLYSYSLNIQLVGY